MFIDSHAHLHFPEFAAELPQVIERAAAAGVKRIVTIATDVPSAREALALATRFDNVYAAVGLHPGSAPEVSLDQLPDIQQLASRPKVVAIGETGLDYFREAREDLGLRDRQRGLFQAQLELARQRHLPVVIHNRAADADTLNILRAHASSVSHDWRPWGVMHCFSGNQRFASECLELGLLISYTGILTYKNAATLQEVARGVGLEHVMLETDCPYLAPTPHRGKRNEPAFIPLIAAMLAQLKGVTVADVARATTENARRLFRW